MPRERNLGMPLIRVNVSIESIIKRANVKRSCRGQASAIGAVLFLALLVLVIAFVQEAYMVQINMNQVDAEKIHENIVITSAYIDSEAHLVINVANRGSVTANLIRLWIINQTDNQYAEIPLSGLHLEPGASLSHVTIQTLNSGQDYAIRIVTERGNIASYNLVPAVHARVSIIAPSSNIIGNNVTIILCITNNDTSGNNIYNLVPQLTVTPNSSLLLQEGPNPSSIELLPSAASAYFVYIYKVTGSGLSINLNATFLNAPEGNYVTTTIFATTVKADDDSSSMPLLNLDIFGSIPALLDSSSGVPTYWGVSVINPYNRTIRVYAVGIVSPSFNIFDESAPFAGIYPTTGWTVDQIPTSSSVFWESSGTPIIIPAYSVYNYTFHAEVNLDSIETPINVEVVTNEGKFVKGFATSVHANYPSMNVYLTQTPVTPTVSRTYALTDILADSTQTFNVVVHNSPNAETLTSRVNLMILVPTGWTEVNAISQPGWNFASQSITQQDDGSWMVNIESSGAVLAGGSSLVFTFSAKTPAVSSKTLYNIPVTAYYPSFSPSITSAYLGAIIQIVP